MKIGHVDWLLNRIEELEMQLSINTNNMKQLQKENECYKQRVEELEEEVEKQKNRKYLKMRQRDDFMKKAQRYKQALEFYADRKNWLPQNDDVLSEITMDYGSKARQALEGDEI